MPGWAESGCPSQVRHHHRRRRNLRHRFEVVKTLGQGTYGKVKLAIERQTGEAYAIKSIRKKQIGTEQDLTRLRREIEIMTRLNHPHIISVYEVFENSDKIILVMEYASGGELYDYCNDKRGLYDEEARKFFRQIISATHYLHTNGIVHRDLKLENIVLDGNGDAKIADFGFANIYNDEKLLSTFCGSPLYASPEIVNGLPYRGPEVDCWSLGVLLYAVVYGAMPFDGSDFRRLRNQITAGEYFKPNRPSDADGLIGELLCPNAARRASIGDIVNHWWVNLGFEYTPLDDTLPGKPVDHKTLLRKLSEGSSSESDCDTQTSHKHSNTSLSASQPSENHCSVPQIKGILKKPKKNSDPVGSLTDCERPPLQRSKSLDVNINISGSSVPSQSSDIGQNNSVNPAFDSTRKPKKSILKKRHSHYGGDCALMTVSDTTPVENDLMAFASNPGCESPEELGAEISDSHSMCELGADVHAHDASSDGYDLGDIESDHVDVHAHDASSDGYDLGDIESVLDSLLDVGGDMFDEETRVDTSDGQVTVDSGILGDLSSSETSPVVEQQSEALTFQGDSSRPDEITECSLISTPRSPDCSLISTPRTAGSRRRKRGVLKNRDDPTWRYSTGSQGSTSSNDLLDFSYDSADCDTLLTEYFSMPLMSPVAANDHSIALEMSAIPDELTAENSDDDQHVGPPPPLSDCPPPDYADMSMDSQEAFIVPCDGGAIIEKILWLGNQDEGAPQSGEIVGSPNVVDWSEVEDIYRKAMELHQEWT